MAAAHGRASDIRVGMGGSIRSVVPVEVHTRCVHGAVLAAVQLHARSQMDAEKLSGSEDRGLVEVSSQQCV